MKLWQKIYLVTICLFVVILNIGIYLVFHMTYGKDILNEQKRAESEYNMIASSICRDFESLDKNDRLTPIQIRSVLEIYENYYASQTIHLTLWEEDACIYPHGSNKKMDFEMPRDKKQINIQGRNNKKVIQVQSLLYEKNAKYYLQYEKSLSELSTAWNRLEKKYLLISMGFSLGLAVLLYFVLRRMMQPIQELTQTVDKMSEGNLDSRMKLKGSDDIAVLGEHFNEMAEKIQDSMLLIQKESEAKQEFVDNFAHELKSPLTSIYGFAEYIQKANTSEQEKMECMEFIMEESTRLLSLSYALLDMAKIRTKEIPMQKVSIDKLFAGIKKQLQKKCEDKEILLEFHNETEEVYGNEVLLQSLLYNLVCNGIYACQENGKILVEAREINGKINLVVEDNGCGICREDIEKITEPFYRVDKARSREEGRTGLGLSLCKQIAECHHAQMAFLSEEGKGTKAIICFSE